MVSTVRLSVTLSRLKFGLATLSAISVVAATTGCLPKDVSMPNVSVSNSLSYEGFTGVEGAYTTGPTKVRLTWTPSKDPTVVAYNIYDSTLLFEPKLIKTIPAPASEITLTGLTTAAYYSFRVRGADKDNVEDTNVRDLGAIPYAGALPAQVTGSTTADIPFADASNADAALIFCTTLTNPIEMLMATVTNVTSANKATLANLSAGTYYTCRAALKIGEFVDNNTVTTSFTPMGTADHLVFATQPGSGASGGKLSAMPVVKILDKNGTVVSAGPDATATISLTVSALSPTSGTIRGTATSLAVGGVATFTDLGFQESGLKIITATKGDTSSQPRGSAEVRADSAQFTISSGNMSPITSSIQISPEVPPNAALVANGIVGYTVTITLKDEFGNPVAGTKPAFASSIEGDTLTQPTLGTDSSGKATGSIATTIADTVAPFRKLSITSPSGLTDVQIAAPFVPGPATKLIFLAQPTNAPAGPNGMSAVKVAVADAQGNVIATGANSSAPISIAIAANTTGAILTGTSAIAATGGVATFSDLGISKNGTNYKLLATSGSLASVYSGNFSVSAGTPAKIAITGPANSYSGTCNTTAITIQLRDTGNNPSKAIAPTPVSISGLGSGGLYTSGTCTGTPIVSPISFAQGTDTKTYYFKSRKGEPINLRATDPSGYMTSADLAMNVHPKYIGLTALNTDGSPLSVVADKCSSEIIIQPAGDDGTPSPIFTPTVVALNGIATSQAKIYDNDTCTEPSLNAESLTLPVTSSSSTAIKYFVKDKKAEVLNLSVADKSATNAMTPTTSGLQPVTVLPSNIGFTGPASVVSGACSAAFTVSIKDALGNLVAGSSARTLHIKGLESSTTGLFFQTADCLGASSKSSLTIPSGSSSTNIYFKNTKSENNSVYIRDPANLLADSATKAIVVSPSAFKITAPTAGSSKTTECVGPFVVNTLDGTGTITNAMGTITGNLTGAGTGGQFFNSASCTTKINQVMIATGTNEATFFYKGQYPNSVLNFAVSDAATPIALSAGSAAWQVKAALAFIGTAAKTKDNNGDPLWFSEGIVTVGTRLDGVRGAYDLHFDGTHNFLFVADWDASRVVKYDYINKKYLGWLGKLESNSRIGISGSAQAEPTGASCQNTPAWGILPGFCLGGTSTAEENTTKGGIYLPAAIADDGTYIYVLNYGSHSINRYNLESGAFKGWIGGVSGTPPATGAPAWATSQAACSTTLQNNPTPGWCYGGSTAKGTKLHNDTDLDVNLWKEQGNGVLYYPISLTYSNGYLFAQGNGAIVRYNAATGAFAGWVGAVGTATPTSPSNCASLNAGDITPNWCYGGKANSTRNPRDFPGSINGLHGMLVKDGVIYAVMNAANGVIVKYKEDTGEFLGLLPNLPYNWRGPRKITTDGTSLFLADYDSIKKINLLGQTEGWIGKVEVDNSLGTPSGLTNNCASVGVNENTPGFCTGGKSKAGMDDGSFVELTAIAYDGNGSLITSQITRTPGIKRFNSTTGVYTGTLGGHSVSPSEWSNDATVVAQYHGLDDKSMYGPYGIHHDGTYLYMTEFDSGSIKKIDPATGAILGRLGARATKPTSGGPLCLSAGTMGGSPAWCLGSLPIISDFMAWSVILNFTTTATLAYPKGITSDGPGGNYIFVAGNSAISKFNKTTGEYIGWIGGVDIKPTGGATNCDTSAPGTYTPGWCTGGWPRPDDGTTARDGFLNNPTAITYANGKLYVIEDFWIGSNELSRVSSYDATTGAYLGWIGRIGTTPTGGCTYGPNFNNQYIVSQNGWCKGGKVARGASSGDATGGFAFWTDSNGIVTDGTHLYITNFYNFRIDKYTLNGAWVASTTGNPADYSNGWSTSPEVAQARSATIRDGYTAAIWMDSTHMYGAQHGGLGSVSSPIWKMDLSSGKIFGWKGTVLSPPTNGEAGCDLSPGEVTPGWCKGGQAAFSLKLGGFTTNVRGISGDANYLYVTDRDANRVTRIPK